MKKIFTAFLSVLLVMSLAYAKDEMVLKTTLGDMRLKLFPQIAPKACENFVSLAKKGYYDGVIFHRVIKGFMVQSGDPTGTGRGGQSIWGKEFKDEFKPNITFDRTGILAMANHGANTNGSQFFITTAPTRWLNGRHTIFGEVVGGFDVLRKIESVKTDGRDKPLKEIKILKIERK